MDYKQILRAAMVEHGLTQKDLAVKSGVHESTVSHIFTGKRNLSITNAKKLAEVLNLDWKDLF